jgi:hypothetical protein
VVVVAGTQRARAGLRQTGVSGWVLAQSGVIITQVVGARAAGGGRCARFYFWQPRITS